MSRPEGFAAVPTWMIRDLSISRNAILVYASLASRSGPGGIYPSQATISAEIGLSERTVRTCLGELVTLGVIEKVRRTAKARGKSNRLPDGYVLHPNGKLAATDAGSSDSYRKPETELPATDDVATGNEQQVTPLIGRTREVEPDEVEPRKRGSRIPDPFMLTSEMQSWAASEVPGLDVVSHTREFVDHWRAASGQTATKRDWVAAWRNWMRKAHRWNAPRATQRATPDDRVREGFDRGARLAALADAEQRGITA